MKLNSPHVPVITIDGPSGTGKGTVSQQLAHQLGWHYLDSGAIYRVLAWAAVVNDVDLMDNQALITLAKKLDLSFDIDSKSKSRAFSNHQEITNLIRSEECGQNASKIATNQSIREALLERQRAFAIAPGLVTDGRDMGTVVFPMANLKIFLYASVEERAHRRYLQLKNIQKDVSIAQVIEQLAERDARDTERSCSPLKPAEDAIQIDTTHLSVAQVLHEVLALVKKKFLQKR